MTGARLLREIVSGPEVAMYVADRLNIQFALPYTTMGLKRDGVLVAGIVFNNYTGPDIEVTVVADDLPRPFLRRVGNYVFNELACIRCTVTTEIHDVAASAVRLGGQTEGRKRNQFGEGRDGIVVGILRNDWKFR